MLPQCTAERTYPQRDFERLIDRAAANQRVESGELNVFEACIGQDATNACCILERERTGGQRILRRQRRQYRLCGLERLEHPGIRQQWTPADKPKPAPWSERAMDVAKC